MVKESGRDRDRNDRSISSSSSNSSRSNSRIKDSSRREMTSVQAMSSTSKKLRTESEPADKKKDTQITVQSVSKGKTGNVNDSPTSTSQSKSTSDDKAFSLGKKEVYDSVVEWELQKSKNLKIDKELDAYMKACRKLENLMTEIFNLKLSGKVTTDVIEKLKTEGLMLLMELRRRNRFMKLKQKSVKEEGLNLRHEVDYDHLLLQNLLYEATHLTKQVAAVQDYKGADSKIDLIPVEQFYAEAPESITKEDKTKTDPHFLRIARLEYEYMQRQKLTEQIAALEAEKNTVAKTIDDEQFKLDNLRPLLSKTLESTVPLQEFLGINITERKQQYQNSQHLPAPLYVLFVQSIAYQDSRDGLGPINFNIGICGDVESVKDVIMTPENEEPDDDSDSDKEQEDNFDADEVSTRRPLRKRSSFIQSIEDRKNKIIQKHPLWIEWIIRTKDGECITVQFFYLVKLKIVTVKSKVEVVDPIINRVSLSDTILNSDKVLTNLFSNDFGVESPNPANTIMLQAVDVETFSEILTEVGHPYKWAQKLAGLDFPCLFPCFDQSDKKDTKFTQEKQKETINVDKTLKVIRKRLSNQKKLWLQLKLLDSRSAKIPDGAKHLFPPKNSSVLTSWEPIQFSQFTSYAFAHFVDIEIVNERNLFFKSTVERGRAKMTALISLSTDFPKVPSHFCLQLEQDGEERNATNDPSIRDIEKELNVYAVEDFSEWCDCMVVLQLQRLLYCTDVLLETDFLLGEYAGPSEFAREKLIMNPAKGRNLRRPFQYVSGSGYFVQRY